MVRPTRDGVITLGAIGLVVAGALFLVTSGLALVAGPPPSDGAAILAWRDAHFLPLALTSEVLFFAAGAVIPGVIAIYRGFARGHPSAVLGCGLIALTIPVLAMTLIVHGRLVYPVFGIRAHTADQAELLVGLYFGGLHASLLLFALGTLALSIGQWKRAPRLAILGLITVVADVLASYPDAIGPVAAFACGALFALWLAATGVWLLKQTAEAVSCA